MVTPVQPVTDEKAALIPINVTVRDHHNPVAGSTIFDVPDGLPARAGAIQSAQARHPLVGGKEVVSTAISSVTIFMASLIYGPRSAALKAWISFLSPSSDGILRRRWYLQDIALGTEPLDLDMITRFHQHHRTSSTTQ